MPIPANAFESDKKEIEVSLTRTILTQLQNNNITQPEAQEIARFILSEIDNIKDISAMSAFLLKLAGKWNVFESIAGFYKIRAKEIEDENKQNQLKKIEDSLLNISN